ncbi:MAG: hypothetical protein U9M90_03740 [Patescibacteria group bacterium]|nr:hypothetical protein [Patescibacteria group bacterium]
MFKKQSVIRLEQALQYWEWTCFIAEMILRHGNEEMKRQCNVDLSGPIINHHKLRKALLKTTETFILDDYIGGVENLKYLSEMAWLPLSLFSWTRFSRRVFQFSPDLQTLLSAISLERVTWDTINLPLSSFIITFPEPLDDGLGWQSDCVLFADVTEFIKEYRYVEDGKRVLHFSLFSTNLGSVKPISLNDRKKIKKAASRKNYSKFGALAKKYLKEEVAQSVNTRKMRAGFIEISQGKGENVLETFRRQTATANTTEDEYQRFSVVDKALHQMVAFCLYLDSLKSSERKRSIEEVRSFPETKQTRISKAITDVSEIFIVKCEHYLSDEEKLVINEIRETRKTESQCVHWRRGYCRRLPGKGNDPNAPKVVIVKPTLVNAKLLKPDTLPVGSKSILT